MSDMWNVIGTCDRCQYWEREDGTKRLHGCGYPGFKYGYVKEVEEQVTDDSAMFENEGEWGFLTGPKFGCIHWSMVVPSESE